MHRLTKIIKGRSVFVDYDQGFDLSSGKHSHYIIDMKPVLLDPRGSNIIARLMYEKIRKAGAKNVGGLESSAIPITSIVCMYSLNLQTPLYGFYIRKEEKDHGTKNRIEGNMKDGENVVIVDDVTTTGSSIIKSIECVREYKCTVTKAISVVDRQEGAKEKLEDVGVEFDYLLSVDSLLGSAP